MTRVTERLGAGRVGPGRSGERPRYVSRWGPGSLPPLVCRGMVGHTFVLEGNLESLKSLCDRYLTGPTGNEHEYLPVSRHVVLALYRATSLSSGDPQYRSLGWATEQDAMFALLTVAVKRVRGEPVADHLAWFIPYIFVDNPMAISQGRETYGFPKEMGWIELPPAEQLHRPERFTLDAFAWAKLSPDSLMTRLRLLKVDRVDTGAAAFEPTRLRDEVGAPATEAVRHGDPDSLEGVLRAVQQLIFRDRPFAIPGVRFVESVAGDLLRRDLRVVFLKQFYDAEDGNYACYQAIVEATARVTSVQAGLLSGRYRVDLSRLKSHPIHDDLGLQDTQTALFGFYSKFDCTYFPGRAVWEAP